MNKHIYAAPRNASYSQMLAFINAKPSRADKLTRIVVRPRQSSYGGGLDGHRVTIADDGVIRWSMHNTVVAIWHPEGGRQLGGAGYAEHPSTREVWQHLLGVRVYKLDRKDQPLFDTDYRVASAGLPFGAPCINYMHIASNGWALPNDGQDECVVIPDMVRRKELSAIKRDMMKYVRAACAVLPDHAGAGGWAIGAEREFNELFRSVLRGDGYDGVAEYLMAASSCGIAMKDVPKHVASYLTLDKCTALDSVGPRGGQFLPLAEGQRRIQEARNGQPRKNLKHFGEA